MAQATSLTTKKPQVCLQNKAYWAQLYPLCLPYISSVHVISVPLFLKENWYYLDSLDGLKG